MKKIILISLILLGLFVSLSSIKIPPPSNLKKHSLPLDKFI